MSDLELAEKRTMATLQRAALAESEWNRQHLPATPINQETKEGEYEESACEKTKFSW